MTKASSASATPGPEAQAGAHPETPEWAAARVPQLAVGASAVLLAALVRAQPRVPRGRVARLVVDWAERVRMLAASRTRVRMRPTPAERAPSRTARDGCLSQHV